MPIYEYRCTECGHEMEALQAMSARPLRSCPECKGKLQRMHSAPAFQFKGSGWYVTDYAKKGADKKGSDADGAAGSGDSGTTKGDAKATPSKDSGSKGAESKTKKKAEVAS